MPISHIVGEVLGALLVTFILMKGSSILVRRIWPKKFHPDMPAIVSALSVFTFTILIASRNMPMSEAILNYGPWVAFWLALDLIDRRDKDDGMSVGRLSGPDGLVLVCIVLAIVAGLIGVGQLALFAVIALFILIIRQRKLLGKDSAPEDNTETLSADSIKPKIEPIINEKDYPNAESPLRERLERVRKAVQDKCNRVVVRLNRAQKIVLLVGLGLLVLRIGYFPEASGRRLRRDAAYTVRYDTTWMFTVHCVGIICVSGIGMYLFKKNEDESGEGDGNQ